MFKLKSIVIASILSVLLFSSCSTTIEITSLDKELRYKTRKQKAVAGIDVYYDAKECSKEFEVVAIHQPFIFSFPIFYPYKKAYAKSYSYKVCKKALEMKADAVIIDDWYLSKIVKYK